MSPRYDIVTIGGGLGGAALARAMAGHGARVLVLERSVRFADRVRGEVLVPWGCSEARKLGLLDELDRGCGHRLLWWDADFDGAPVLHREVVAATPHRLPVLTYFHPSMQEIVLESARRAGAHVRRGAVVKRADPAARPRVVFRDADGVHRVEARLVVGADGRGSSTRRWGGFETQSDRPRRFFAGILLDELAVPEDTLHSRIAPSRGLISWLFPQGGGRVRAYVGYDAASGVRPLSGSSHLARFVEMSIELGVPAEAFRKARAAGPLATFDGTETWVEHPYRDGIALLGDAAATSDPTWGQGMSLTLHDVQLLAEALRGEEDWQLAGHRYAAEHDRAFAACHLVDGWFTDLFLELGEEAEARRARALPRIALDPSRIPDTPLCGPEPPPDAGVRRRFFGEDA